MQVMNEYITQSNCGINLMNEILFIHSNKLYVILEICKHLTLMIRSDKFK